MTLLLLGGGHSMLPTLLHAAAWTRQGVDVSLVDANRWLYYSGMVPEYLGGVYAQSEVRIDLPALCDQAGVSFVHGTASAIDPDARRVAVNGTDHSYDVLAVDVGGVNPHRPDGTIATKPIYHVEAMQTRIREVLASPSASLDLCIVGGGAAGIEVALNVTGRFRSAGRQRALSLSLVEASDRLLPGFPAGLQTAVTRRLRRRGATIHTGTRVTNVSPGAVTTDGPSLSPDTVLWATGSVGPDLLAASGLPTDDDGFLRVDEALRSRDPRIFAAGDCATIDGYETLAKVGVHAVKQGPVLRQNLDHTLQHLKRHDRLPPSAALSSFTPYPAAPLILSTGRNDGLWTSGPAWWAHPLALRLKHWVDRRWMRAYNSAWRDRPLRAYADARSAAGPRS